MFGTQYAQIITWIALAVIFIIIEALTVQLTTIWFALGAIGAVVAYFCQASPMIQMLVFVLLSVISLIIARPFVKRYTKTKVQPTNIDMLIGQQAIVTQRIDNIAHPGQVSVRGIPWTVLSEDGSIIEADAIVTIVKIEGTKLIVKQ